MCNSISIELLTCLSDALRLEGKDRFENSHRENVAANCSLNIFRYPRSSAGDACFRQNKHTDNGSLTFLLTDQPGLEILSPESKEWGIVEPKENHAVINVGDTVRFLSGQQLRPAVHRTVPVFGVKQAHRISIGYFLRAEDDAQFQDCDGVSVTAREWHDRKYLNYKEPHVKQRENSILLGGVETDGNF
jgi:isopenicillin N synthase-like dioxygenase